MNKKLKELMFSTKRALVATGAGTEVQSHSKTVGMYLKSMASLGFMPTPHGIEVLKTLSLNELKQFYAESFEFLKAAIGWRASEGMTFYRNFPNIPDDDGVLWLNATLHYISVYAKDLGIVDSESVYYPTEAPRARLPFDEDNKPILFDIVYEKEANKIIIDTVKSTLASKLAIPEYQKEIVESAYKTYKDEILPDTFSCKENMGLAARTIYNFEESPDIFSIMQKYINTETDVLRVYAAISQNGGELLASKIKFKTLPRYQRRSCLKVIGSIYDKNAMSATDDFKRHMFLWTCALRMLHASELSYDKNSLWTDIRSGKLITWNSTVVEAINNKNMTTLVKTLCIKPGEFARRLNWLLTADFSHADKLALVAAFKSVASKVAINILISLVKRFELNYENTLETEKTYMFSHDGVSVVHTETKDPIRIDDDILKALADALHYGISEYEKSKCGNTMPKVFISDFCKTLAIPENARDASSSAMGLPRFSRIKLSMDEGNVIRVFTHWKNKDHDSEKGCWNDGRVDIDLSAYLIGDEGTYLCGWNGRYGGADSFTVYSGDITDAPNGATEYIDINVAKAKATGYRYAVVQNNSYCGIPWKEIPECFSGVMFRKNLGTRGEIYEPKSVKIKFDLANASAAMETAFVIDLVNGELIWVDAAIGNACGRVASASFAQSDGIIRKATEKQITWIDFIALLNGKRYTVTSDPLDADIILGYKESVSAYNTNAEFVVPGNEVRFCELFM